MQNNVEIKRSAYTEGEIGAFGCTDKNSLAAAAVAAAKSTDAAADGAAPVNELKNTEGFHFSLRREIFYHSMREQFFSSALRTSQFLNIALGAGVIAPFFPPSTAGILGFLIALNTALQIVFDFDAMRRRHGTLRARLMELYRLEAAGASLDELNAKLIEIDSSAPPSFKAVEMIAHNKTVISLDWPTSEIVKVTAWQRLMANLWPFSGTCFRTNGQISKLA